MKIATILATLAVPAMLFAQSGLPKYVSNPVKVYKSINYDMAKDWKVKVKDLPCAPKKVALVSFFVFDPGLTKVSYWETSTQYGSTTEKRNAGGNMGPIALGFYAASIEPLKAKFKEYGMDLLEPEQFLDNDTKKEYFTNFKVEHGALSNWINKMGSGGHDAMFGTVEGYPAMDVVMEPFENYSAGGTGAFAAFAPMTYQGKVTDNQVFFYSGDTKMFTSLGYDLATNLGVDAVAYVYCTVYCPSDKKIVLQNANLYMFGPNPVQIEPGKKKLFYSRGLSYAGVRIETAVPILNINKKDPESKKISAAGFDVLMVQMAAKLGDYFKKELAKKK